MNRARLAKVRDRIAAVGDEHCDMESFTHGRMLGNGEPVCGTTACIAGHALALKFGAFDETRPEAVFSEDVYDMGEEAAKWLGLSSRMLFFKGEWPVRFRWLADNEGDAKGMLAICDALLDGTISEDDLSGDRA